MLYFLDYLCCSLLRDRYLPLYGTLVWESIFGGFSSFFSLQFTSLKCILLMYNWFSKFSVPTPNTKTYSVSVSSTNADGSSLALGCICFTPFIVQQGFNTNGLDSDWLSIFWGNQSFPLTECKGQGTFYRWSGKKDMSHIVDTAKSKHIRVIVTVIHFLTMMTPEPWKKS